MHCQEVREQLAIYRELNPVERQRVEEHVATCPGCSATLAAYRAQDQLLSALPVLAPSPALIEAVHARTVGRRKVARSYSWQRALAALALVLFFTVAAATVSSASAALPGDPLYPIKRAAEQARLALLLDPALREEYQQRLVETRQEEVRAVIALQRMAQVEFQAGLVAAEAGLWQVNGFQVRVGPAAWAGEPPPEGTMLAVKARAAAGQLEAVQVQLLRPALPTAVPRASPAGPLSPSHTPTMRQASPEPTTQHSPTASAPPSATPGMWGPGPQPSITPGAWGPGPQPSLTPGAWGPGPQPSATAGTPEPEPQPSATPATWGPGPQPSATPGTPEPGPQPSVTPTAWGPGPQPSATPRPPEPEPQPSATAAWGPGPQPSATPPMPGPGPQPSSTPGVGGR